VEELSEVICWTQLGIHRKIVGIVNTLGFYDHYLQHLDHCIATGFTRAKYSGCWCSAAGPVELLDRMELAVSTNAVPEGAVNTWTPFPAGLAAAVELEEMDDYQASAT